MSQPHIHIGCNKKCITLFQIFSLIVSFFALEICDANSATFTRRIMNCPGCSSQFPGSNGEVVVRQGGAQIAGSPFATTIGGTAIIVTPDQNTNTTFEFYHHYLGINNPAFEYWGYTTEAIGAKSNGTQGKLVRNMPYATNITYFSGNGFPAQLSVPENIPAFSRAQQAAAATVLVKIPTNYPYDKTTIKLNVKLEIFDPSGTLIYPTQALVSSGGGDVSLAVGNPNILQPVNFTGIVLPTSGTYKQQIIVNTTYLPLPKPSIVTDYWMKNNALKVNASYSPVKYTLTATAVDSNGTQIGQRSSLFDAGTDPSWTPIGIAGFVFDRWTNGCDWLDGMNRSICHTLMKANRTITALYRPVAQASPQRLLIYSTQPVGASVVPQSTGVYNAGTTHTITAQPNPGFTFDRWIQCPNAQGSSCIVTLGGVDVSVIASFRSIYAVAPPQDTPSPSPSNTTIVPKPGQNGAPNTNVSPNTPVTGNNYDSQKGQSNGNNALAEDPVSMSTGHYYLSAQDIDARSTSIPLKLVRSYSSANIATVSPMGRGWTHNFNMHLMINPDGSLDYVRADGSSVHYTPIVPNGPTAYQTTVPGNTDTLSKDSIGLYTLVTKYKMVYVFNTRGLPTAITDPNLNSLVFSYDLILRSQLNSITDTLSMRKITFTYLNNYINSVSNSLGLSVTYTHDAAGNLTQVTDVRGGVTKYLYDTYSQMYSATDPEGNNFIRNNYYTNLQVSSQQDALGHTSHFNFLANGKSELIDRLGFKHTYTHGSKGELISETSPTTYDAQGSPQIRTTTYGYNTNGYRTSISKPINISTFKTYDAFGNVLTSKNNKGEITNYTYDPNNHKLTSIQSPNTTRTEIRFFQYDTKGHLTQKTDYRGKPTKFTYTASGLLKDMTDANLHITTYQYNGDGTMKSITTPFPLSESSIFAYDTYGNVNSVSLLTELGILTTNRLYDKAGHLLSETDPLSHSIQYTYDKNGKRTSVTDPMGNQTSYIYNANRQLQAVVDAAGATTSYSYDAEDHLITTTGMLGFQLNKSHDEIGQLTSTTDANGATEQYNYDLAGRLITTTDPLGHTTVYGYDLAGRVNSISRTLTNGTAIKSQKHYDENGRIDYEINKLKQKTSYLRDKDGRIIQTTKQVSPPTVSKRSYDAVGNLQSMTGPRGNKTTFVYDKLNRPIHEVNLLGNQTTTTYNSRGLISSFTNMQNQLVTYGYDAGGRLKTETYPGYTITHKTLDPNGNRKKSISSLGPVINRTFDVLNRLTSRTDAWGNTVKYYYDLAGNLLTIIYPPTPNHPNGLSVHYEYDKMNRMTSVSDWNGRITRYNYDMAGNLVHQSLPDGTTVTFTYDNLNRLKTMTDQRPTIGVGTSTGTAGSGVLGAGATTTFGGTGTATTPSQNGMISQYIYTLDAAGKRTKVTPIEPLQATLTPVVHAFTYDSMNRLTSRDTDSFSYDADSNMTSRSINGSTKALTYDPLGRLLTFGTDSYRYDSDGYRIESTIHGITKRYINDVHGAAARVLVEQDATGAAIAHYVYGLGLLYREDANGNIQVYHYDSRGSTVALTDVYAQTTDTFAYDPFGKLTNRTGTTQQPFTYNGRDGVINDGNGLYYMQTRYFDAELMRFISKDILKGNVKSTQSLNPFAYVEGNPVNYIDPMGMSAGADSPSVTNLGQKTFNIAFGDDIKSCRSFGDNLLAGTPSLQGYGSCISLVCTISCGGIFKTTAKVGYKTSFIGKGLSNSKNAVLKRVKINSIKDPEILRAIERAKVGDKTKYPGKDGTKFYNNAGKYDFPGLPANGRYREYTITTQGSSDRGVKRLVKNMDTGQYYITTNHYNDFIEVIP